MQPVPGLMISTGFSAGAIAPISAFRSAAIADAAGVAADAVIGVTPLSKPAGAAARGCTAAEQDRVDHQADALGKNRAQRRFNVDRRAGNQFVRDDDNVCGFLRPQTERSECELAKPELARLGR